MEEIDLRDIFSMFWEKKVLIIVITIGFALLGVFYTTKLVKPEYKGVTTLVLVKSNDDVNSTITQTDVTLNQKLVSTYTVLIESDTVLREVIHMFHDEVEEEVLRKKVKVNLVTGTQLIEISVKDEDPEFAQKYTNQIAKVFIEQVKQIYNINNINIVDEAKLPTTPFNINPIRDMILFILLGIIVSCGYIILLNTFDTTVKTQEKAEKYLNLTVLALIPECDEWQTKKKGKR